MCQHELPEGNRKGLETYLEVVLALVEIGLADRALGGVLGPGPQRSLDA